MAKEQVVDVTTSCKKLVLVGPRDFRVIGHLAKMFQNTQELEVSNVCIERLKNGIDLSELK